MWAFLYSLGWRTSKRVNVPSVCVSMKVITFLESMDFTRRKSLFKNIIFLASIDKKMIHMESLVLGAKSKFNGFAGKRGFRF